MSEYNSRLRQLRNVDKPALELVNVSMSYQKDMEVIKDVSFSIDKGEFVFIVGHTGSGKSTLIKLLMRSLRPTSGKIYFNGQDTSKMRGNSLIKFRRKLGVVFQDFKLLKDRNVYENVAFAQRVIEKSNKEIAKNVPAVLSIVGLSDKYNANPKELSGGEQQRVAVARALVNNPLILLADEPTGNLDPKTSWEIMNLLDDINKCGTTVIVVTHSEDIVNVMQKRVIRMENGQLKSDVRKGGYDIED